MACCLVVGPQCLVGDLKHVSQKCGTGMVRSSSLLSAYISLLTVLSSARSTYESRNHQYITIRQCVVLLLHMKLILDLRVDACGESNVMGAQQFCKEEIYIRYLKSHRGV